MIKTVLIDDELRLLRSLKLMLEECAPQIEVLACCSNSTDAIEKLKSIQPDLVFMDIAMPGMNAFELLQEVKDIPFQIIFVTGHSEYSIRAFKYSAVGYLLKPVDEDELMEAVHKAIKSITDKNLHNNLAALLHNIKPETLPHELKLSLSTLYGFQVVSVSDIIYCAADNTYTNFHLKDSQKICVSKPLIEFEMLLENNDFIRIHKSFLINLNHIKEYRRGDGGVVVMSNKDEIEVSRRKKELFLEKAKAIFKF